MMAGRLPRWERWPQPWWLVGWQRQWTRRALLLLAVVLVAQVMGPHAGEVVRRVAAGGQVGLLAVAMPVCWPFAAGESLAAWGPAAAAPLLRALPAAAAGLTAWATLAVARRAVAWAAAATDTSGTTTEWWASLLGLPPVPLEPRVMLGATWRAAVASAAGSAWTLASLEAMRWFITGPFMGIFAGDPAWATASAADGARLTLVAAALGLVWPAVVLSAIPPELAPKLIGGASLAWMAAVLLSRWLWWRSREGEPVALTPGAAEEWLRKRRRWPRRVLACLWGGERAVEALDRAAVKALMGE